MASPLIAGVTLHLRNGLKQFQWTNILNKQIQERTQYYSIYSPYYIDPIYNPKKQKELIESGEMAKLNHLPVKPAQNHETSSVYNDTTLMKFTNYVMKCGNKRLARSLMEQAFEKIKRIQLEKYNKETDPEKKAKIVIDPIKILYAAIDNCKPLLMLTPIKRGGATYQVPIPITEKRALFLSMNWLVESGKEKDRTVSWSAKMAHELIEASENKGRVVKKKQDLHRQCEANRAYAHYRWS